MCDPLVTILIPSYNDALYLQEVFDDLILQTHTNIQCIFINDCSTDNTKQIYEQNRQRMFDRGIDTIYLETDKNVGTGSALNYGLMVGTGNFYTWWSSDDRKHKTFVDDMVRPFIIDPDVDYVIGGFCANTIDKRPYIKVGNDFYFNRWLDTTVPGTDDILITDDKIEFLTEHRNRCINGICFMFSSRIKTLFGLFAVDPEEDYLMSATMITLANKIAFLNKTVGTHCLRPDSLTLSVTKHCDTKVHEIIDNYLREAVK